MAAIARRSWLLLLLTISGCKTLWTEAPIGATHGVWVTRFDYRSESDIRRIFEEIEEEGFNTVMFQVRGNGTAFYRSRFEPWADELGGLDPGFDPLEVACREADRLGLSIHAWVNVIPSWRGSAPPTNYRQLYHAHPEWHLYAANGDREPLPGNFYVGLNPCLPEVRAYLVAICQEIVADYEVDGLHLDYIRFVDDRWPDGREYGRDPITVARFSAKTGTTPDRDEEAWRRWRADQVTALVREIRAMMTELPGKSGVWLSAAVAAAPEGRTDPHHRDSGGWSREGLLDAVFPMNYTADTDLFEQRVERWAQHEGSARVVTGIRVSPDRSLDLVTRQLQIAHHRSPHLCLFAYSELFGGDDPVESQRRFTLRRRLRQFFENPARFSNSTAAEASALPEPSPTP